LERARQSAGQTELSRARLAADDLQAAQAAHELLSTVGESMKDAWVPERTQKLSDDISAADVEVHRQVVRLEILALLDKIQKSGPELELDPINQRVEQLLAAVPALAKDAKILEQQAAARRAEAGHIRYTPHPADDSPPIVALDHASTLGQQTIAVVWGRPATAADGPASRTAITSLARGILYVFDEQGAVRWFRRLGVDSYRPPVRVLDGSTAAEILLAVSSESNSLTALDAETGKLLWSYRPQADISGPLTVIDVPQRNGQAPKRRGMLPTANGEIHVLELSLGKCLGRYRLGRSMTVGGVYDSQTGLAFFPADSERVFALDPAAIDDPRRAACPSLLYTRHPSGAFRSPPSVVGQYLILPESSDLTQTRLRVFETSKGGFADPQARPLAEQAVQGWSWFAPLATPDRIMLATDQGELGLFGVNLDNRNEALYPMIEGGSNQTIMHLPTDGASPTLAAHADGFLLWALAGGRLYKLAVDFFGQTIRSLWPESAPASTLGGSPVHEAQTVSVADRPALCLTTMSANGRRYQATAVDADEGELLWQRQLGLHPIGDPIIADGRVLLIDANGQTLAVEAPDDSSASVSHLVQPSDSSGPGNGEADVIRFSALDGAIWLAVESAEEKTLAVRPAATNDGWRRLPLVERLQGRPALLGDFLIVPCADGQLYRLRVDGRAAPTNEQLFRWRRDSAPETDTAEIYPLTSDSIFLCDGKRRLRRLQFRTKDQVSQWFEVGDAYESAHRLTTPCLVAKDHVLVADDAGEVHALDIHSPGRLWRSWSLGGRASGELLLAGDRLLAVVDRRRLACLDPSGAEENDKPRWTVGDFEGRICGSPLVVGETVMVTDASRHVTGIRRDNGERLWRLELAPHVGPMAAAAPLGTHHLLAPLADGTLLLAPLPDKAQDFAEASP
ncbi:MAG TPA: PQQ-binding-like beta-propeller repeat protein, partial [Pirellulales bacterium]|nr:PQQ-binding-like beta-propeller repeat protein [Pirellulales bacterium]